jgi:hypothetical protein
MQFDFQLFYTSVLLSFEDDKFNELQKEIRRLITKSRENQIKFYETGDSEYNKLYFESKVAYIESISNCPYFDLIKEKGEEIIQSVKEFIEEGGFEVLSVDVDALIIDDDVNINDVRKFIRDSYGDEFHIEVS